MRYTAQVGRGEFGLCVKNTPVRHCLSMYQQVSDSYLESLDRRGHAQRHIDPSRVNNAERRISVRVTDEQYSVLLSRANVARLSLAEYVRAMLELATNPAR